MQNPLIRYVLMICVLLGPSGCAEHVQIEKASLELADVRDELKTTKGSSVRVNPATYLAFRFSLKKSLERFADDRYMLWAECNVITSGNSATYSWPEGPFTIAGNKVAPDSLHGPDFIAFVFRGLNAYSTDDLAPTPLKALYFDRIDCQLTHRVMMLGWRMESDVVSFSREEVLRVMEQTPQIISAHH